LARPVGENGSIDLLGATSACPAWSSLPRALRSGAASAGLGVSGLVAGARVAYGKGTGQGEVERGSPRRRHGGGEAEEGFRAAVLSGEGGGEGRLIGGPPQ
jgi:hypothetical protein